MKMKFRENIVLALFILISIFLISNTFANGLNEVITYDGNATIYTYTVSGTFTTIKPLIAEILIIAGGGGGGADIGGGGGSGGLIYNTTYEIPIGTYNINIGGSGGGATGDRTSSLGKGYNGQNSSFHTLIAVGGGGGSGYNNGQGNFGGGGGGSGSADSCTVELGGNATENQGFNGGAGSCYSMGGGGGSNSSGTDGIAYGQAGYGGNGTNISISGTYYCYAGGGGAGSLLGTAGLGNCGGGNGVISGNANSASNYGSGGGGGGQNGYGGSGYQGIIIIRFIDYIVLNKSIILNTCGNNYTKDINNIYSTNILTNYSSVDYADNYEFNFSSGFMDYNLCNSINLYCQYSTNNISFGTNYLYVTAYNYTLDISTIGNQTNCSIYVCQNNWIRNTNPCINGDKLVSYTDINYCNLQYNIPLDNNTHISCSNEIINRFEFSDSMIILSILFLFLIISTICAIAIHEGFFGVNAVITSLMLITFIIYKYPSILLYFTPIIIVAFVVMWITVNRIRR